MPHEKSWRGQTLDDRYGKPPTHGSYTTPKDTTLAGHEFEVVIFCKRRKTPG